MSWKKFLKPDWRKIVIAIILFFISSPRVPGVCLMIGPSCPSYWGFPLIFYEVGYFNNVTTNPINFILDLVFWYILSCLIIWIYDKTKKPRRKAKKK